MRTTSTLALLSALFLSIAGLAQDTAFQLQQYKYRTPGFRALAVDFNLSGSYSQTKDFFNEKASNRALSLGPVYLSYQKFISTETRQHQSAYGLRPQADFYGTSHSGQEARFNRFNPTLYWNRSDRFYRANRWFCEVGNQLSASYYRINNKDSFSRYTNKGLYVQDNLVLGVGKGRIENVQDAQMALYLLQDLAAQHLLSRTPTAEESLALARLITDINNRRVFDFRRRRVYELSRLDSFFRHSGLAPQTDIRHFTTLNDNWALALNPGRLSGGSWYLRLQPGVQYQRATQDNSKPALSYTKATKTFLFLMPVVGYENYRPLSLKWQRNYSVSLAYTANRSNENTETVNSGGTTENSLTTNYWRSSLNASYGLGFYPNNRTRVEGSLGVTGDYYRNREYVLLSQLRFEAQYFISYRTYLTASAQARYDYRHMTMPFAKTNPHDFSTGLSVSVSHIVF